MTGNKQRRWEPRRCFRVSSGHENNFRLCKSPRRALPRSGFKQGVWTVFVTSSRISLHEMHPPIWALKEGLLNLGRIFNLLRATRAEFFKLNVKMRDAILWLSSRRIFAHRIHRSNVLRAGGRRGLLDDPARKNPPGRNHALREGVSENRRFFWKFARTDRSSGPSFCGVTRFFGVS